MLGSLCAEIIKPVFEGDKIYLTAVEGNASVYQVNTTAESHVDYMWDLFVGYYD